MLQTATPVNHSVVGSPSAGLGDDYLRRILEQTLIPSPNVTELAERKASAFINRLNPRFDSLAELYHVNTRLARGDLPARFTPTERAAVRSWFFDTCARLGDGSFGPDVDRIVVPTGSLPAGLAGMLRAFQADGPLRPMLYGVDLGVVLDCRYLRQAPGVDHLRVELELTGADVARLDNAVVVADVDVADSAAILVVSGVPWRNMLFDGDRGYRRTLIEAGALLSALGSLANTNGLLATPIEQFVDDEVDAVLRFDGVERFVLALVNVQPSRPADAADAEETRDGGQ